MAGTLGDYRGSSIDSSEILYFLDTTQAATISVDSTSHKATVTGGTFNMMLLLSTENTFGNGMETSETNDVTQKLAISAPAASGSASLDYDQPMLKKDPVCLKLYELYNTKAISGATFTICRCDTWNENKVFVATASIICNSYGGSAQDFAHVAGTIGLISDWVECAKAGVIDSATGELTFAS